MADRRSQSDESVILEYFSLQSIDKCDAMVNLIGDKLRERKRRRVEAEEIRTTPKPERKPQRRRAGKEAVTENVVYAATCARGDCSSPFDANVHHKKSDLNFHEFVEPAEAKAAGGGD